MIHHDTGDQLTLRRTAVHGMDPMPSADTSTVGTRWHVLGDREGGIDIPDTLVVDAENGQILRLNAVYVRGVCNGKGATLHVIDTLKRKRISG